MKTRLIRWSAVALAALLTSSAAGAQDTTSIPLRPSYQDGFLVFQTPDTSFRYWLDGRMQVDGAVYQGSRNALANGTGIRRARLGGKVTLYTNWHGEVDVDFSKNAVEMKDMWIGYMGFTNTLIKFGNYKEPFSLETLTSSKYITFLERSYADNFSPDRGIGVGFSRWGNWWQVAAGAFGETAGTVDASGRDEGHGLTGRFTVAPINRPGRLLHFGVSMSRRTPNGDPAPDTNTVRYRARPETNVSQARFFTTGKIRLVDHTSLYNGEIAGVYGPLSVQAELTDAGVSRLSGLPSEWYSGSYAFVSYFVTGETRPYLVSEGEFDRIYPRSKHGAWEVAARVSGIDLNDPGANVFGGKGTNYTLGVNYYMNANFKWMLDYVRVVTDKNAKPDLGIAPFVTGDRFSIIQTRFSVAF